MSRPLVVVLDVNETLSDHAPARRRSEAVGAPPGMFDAWWAAVHRDGLALAAQGGYAGLAEIGRSLLLDMFTHHGSLEIDPREATDEVLHALEDSPVFTDVPLGLTRLHEGGLRLVTLSNGSREASQRLLDHAGLAPLVEECFSADDVHRWKPTPEPYLYTAEKCGVAPHEMALVSVQPWEVDGAQRVGMQGAFLARWGRHYPAYFTRPDYRASALPQLADALLGR